MSDTIMREKEKEKKKRACREGEVCIWFGTAPLQIQIRTRISR